MTASSDRNLLFGILAMQMDFITRNQLVAAMNAWALEKSKPLGQILVEQQAMSASKRELLEPLVAQHVVDHGGDAQKSLAALSSIEMTLQQQLTVMQDDEIQATLGHIGADRTKTQSGDAAETIAQPAAASSSVGRYRILKPHARGGLGEVFVAEDLELGRKVALKEIQPRHADDVASRGRFVLEAEITGGLEHPGIVPVYGLGAYPDGRPFYAMRFIKGDNLSDAIKRFHRSDRREGEAPAEPARQEPRPPNSRAFDSLEFRQLLQRFIDVCNAVAYAHSRGVLHRDLKPGNIMLGKYGETLVVDWGLAKLAGSPQREQGADETILAPRSAGDSSATIAGSALGTPAYMPPEQAAGDWEKIGPASDVYSLGATLYELLTGKKPFESRVVEVVLEDVRAGRLTAPRRVLPDVPRALEAVCLKAMARNPADRYGSPLDVAKEIERWLADEKVSAFAEPFSFRARRWVRKHSRLTTGLAATLLVGAIGLGALAWQRERARIAVADEQIKTAQERDIAREQKRRTRAALDTMVSPEMVERLGSQKELTKGQREFLQTALNYYREFAGEAATYEEGRKLEALAHFRIGYLLGALGQNDEAAAAHRVAIPLYERLTADFPAEPKYRQELALTHSNLSVFLNNLGRRADAEVAHRAALAIQEALAAKYPDMPQYRRELALTHSNLGVLLNNLGRRADAEAAYRAALAIRERLTADFPALPQYRQDLALTHTNLGVLLNNLGRRADAEVAFRAALAIQERLAADFPAVPQYRQELALTHSNLGVLLNNLGRLADAEVASRAALTIQEKLAADFPAVPEYRQKLAISHNNLGVLLNILGRRADAEAAYRAALLIREKLAADFPAVPEHRQNLALSHNNLALLLKDLGRRVEAEAAHRAALAIREKLATDFPALPDHRIDLAVSLVSLGSFVNEGGNSASAVELHSKAIDLLAPIVAAEPRLAHARQFLRLSYGNRAEVYTQLRRPAEALTDWERALELDDGTYRRGIRVYRAGCLARLGRIAEAVREAGEVAADPSAKADALYGCAGVFAIAVAAPNNADADAHAARGVELLAQAVAKGYKDVEHMKKDSDLDSLRQREDFKKLIAELEAKSKP